MHWRIGLLAGIVSIGRMPGCVVEKFKSDFKNKLRRRRNVVDKYQVSRKCTTRSMSDCNCVIIEIITTVQFMYCI